jgi:hypothetical protein
MRLWSESVTPSAILLNLVILFVGSWACAQPSRSDVSLPGMITGTVINEKGEPVNEALVNASDGQPTIGAIRYFLTDQKEHFVIDRLAWGQYRVFAKKEEAGYPDIGFAFYETNVLEIASISPSSQRQLSQCEEDHAAKYYAFR